MDVEQMLASGYNLYQVCKMLQDGRISQHTANEYFKVWVKGKCEFRWNEQLQQAEELSHNSSMPYWKKMSWKV